MCWGTFAGEELIQPDSESPKHDSLGRRETSIISDHGCQDLNQFDEVDKIAWVEQVSEVTVVRGLTDNVETVTPTALLSAQLPDAGHQEPRANQFDGRWVAWPIVRANLCKLHLNIRHIHECKSQGVKGGMESYHSLHTLFVERLLISVEPSLVNRII